MKRIKNIRIWNIIMVALILVLLLFCIGLFVRSTPDSREERIISYLKGKYDSDFEIVELSFSGNVNLTDEVNFDGTVFFPEIKNIFVYCYEYEVLSKIDNVTFSVSYLDGVFF